MAEILIIEDDLALRTEIQRFLEKKGHGITCAMDGREGLKSVEETPYDVILLDIKIPGVNGIEVLQTISNKAPTHPPVIIISGHGNKDAVLNAIHFGAFDFLEKPFTPDNLEKTIERALSEKKQDRMDYKSNLAAGHTSGLTARESEVAALATEGLHNEEIAQRLSLNIETVKSHLKNVFRKMGVDNRTALAAHLRKIEK